MSCKDSSSEKETIRAVDLFCGGGGLSTALAEACEDLSRDVELIAVNHWGKAIETHKRNHPWATHLNAKIEELHPPNVVAPGSVDILIAAPECTHFSKARGGKPVDEQARASPMHVLDWVHKLQPDAILVENVPEFKNWGPIVNGEPTRDGSKFEAWKKQLEADRYSVQHTKLNAADYGDATSRRRFFVMARRDYRPEFPDPTHSRSGENPEIKPWRSAAEIIDWSDLGESIWTRSRPLVQNTMQRIAEGIRQHCDDRLEPLADTIASLTSDDVKAMQDDIVPASEAADAAANREEPFLVEGGALELDDPSKITSMIMGQHSNARALDADERPVPTIATKGAIHCIHADPFFFPEDGAHDELLSNITHESDDQQIYADTMENHDTHLVSPFFVPYQSETGGQRPRVHSVDEPYPTITATGSDPYLARPFLVEYNGKSDVKSIDEPLPTVTKKDRHALCVPELYPWALDLRYRMLQPRELAAAQGLPEDYEFPVNKTETKKLIGNAVPVNLGKALVKQLLVPTSQPTVTQYGNESGPIAQNGQVAGGGD